MRILYSALAAGNGHLSRAREILPHLQKLGEVDVAVSGTDGQVKLPVEISHKHHGLIFHLGDRGGIDFWKTVKDLRLPRLVKDIQSFPIEDYDIVLNDFEPVTARSAVRAGVPIVSVSHQASFASRSTPRPERGSTDFIAEAILRNYAPCPEKIGIHFEEYDDFIRTPVIRHDVRALTPTRGDHITVYLPGYDDQHLIDIFTRIPEQKWDIFSKKSPQEFFFNNVHVRPVNAEAYTKSLGACDGLLTGGGFESPAEAMFLGKKVLMVPLKSQFEQRCNAEAARHLGAEVLTSIDERSLDALAAWAIHGKAISIPFPDQTEELLADAIDRGFREVRLAS